MAKATVTTKLASTLAGSKNKDEVKTPEANEKEAPQSETQEGDEEVKGSYVWIRDINFGQHKVGDTYKGEAKDVPVLLEKGWIKQK